MDLTKIYINEKYYLQPPKSEDSFNGVIPIDQIQIKYDRSSGPGGQNVNKVNTKVDLRFHVNGANWLSDQLKEKLIEQVSWNLEVRIFFKAICQPFALYLGQRKNQRRRFYCHQERCNAISTNESGGCLGKTENHH